MAHALPLHLFINKCICLIFVTFQFVNFKLQVYFSHRCNFNAKEFPDNIKQVPTVKEVKNKYVIYNDGTVSDHIDTILLCTGKKIK